MSFAFADGFHAGLDCAGEASPGLGVTMGWVRHGAEDHLEVGAESVPGTPVGVRALSFHRRPDVPAGFGLAVTGFVLLHDVPERGGGILLLRAGRQEARLDLGAYDVPRDVPAALAASAGRGAFDLLAAAGAAPDEIPLLGDGPGLGPFERYLARQARVIGAMDWFQDFRRVAAHRSRFGEVVIAGVFAAPGGAEAAEVSALPLVTSADGAIRVGTFRSQKVLGLPEGFVLHGFVDDAGEGDRVEIVTLVRRGDASWAFRAEATPAPLEAFFDALGLVGFEAPDHRAVTLERWMREALDVRLAGLRDPLTRLSIFRGVATASRGTALIFDLDEPLAARVVGLMAPMLEERFEKIVVTGAAAARAVAALQGRPGLEVTMESGVEDGLAAAANSAGAVVPADTASLASMAISGDMPGATGGRGLDPSHLDEILLLHGVAGTGGLTTTLRRVTAILEGQEGVPIAATVRGGATGAAIAAHLAAVWRAATPAAGAAA